MQRYTKYQYSHSFKYLIQFRYEELTVDSRGDTKEKAAEDLQVKTAQNGFI